MTKLIKNKMANNLYKGGVAFVVIGLGISSLTLIQYVAILKFSSLEKVFWIMQMGNAFCFIGLLFFHTALVKELKTRNL